MVVDKKHEPVYCWNSDKTYSILSVKKVLIKGIIYCMLMYLVYCFVFMLRWLPRGSIINAKANPPKVPDPFQGTMK